MQGRKEVTLQPLVLRLQRLANHSISGGTSASLWNSAAVRRRFDGRIALGSWFVIDRILILIKSVITRGGGAAYS